MQCHVPAQNSHEEEAGLHEEQTCRNAVSVVNEAVQKRKSCTSMKFQSEEGRTDSLKLKIRGYLKKEAEKRCNKTKGQPPLAPRQHASEADTLRE